MPTEYYDISFSDKIDPEHTKEIAKKILPFHDSELLQGPIIQSKLLTNRVDPTVPHVYEITIGLPANFSRNFEAGDTIGILPKNDEKEIFEILNLLNLSEHIDKIVQIKGSKIPAHIPANGSTLKDILTNCLDIRSVPSKLFLKSLALQTDDAEEIERLNKICTAGNSAQYSVFVTNEGKSLLGILKAFPRCQPTLSTLIKFLPSLKPRPYSVVWTYLEETDKYFTIVFSARHENEKGVCSGYLEKFYENHTPQLIQYYFRKPTDFRMPIDNKQGVIILISTGVGISPFMGFLKERNEGASNCEMYLYYGCRYEKQDFLYKEQLEEYRKGGILTKLYTAFSRDGPQKVYIQDRIKDTWEEFHELITKENTCIYICGDLATVITDIKRTITNLLIEYNGLPEDEAKNIVETMEKNKKIITDIWV